MQAGIKIKSSAVAEMAAQCRTVLWLLRSSAGYFFMTYTFSVIYENITIKHKLPKLDSLGYIYVQTILAYNFNHCEVIGRKLGDLVK